MFTDLQHHRRVEDVLDFVEYQQQTDIARRERDRYIAVISKRIDVLIVSLIVASISPAS